MALVTRRTRWPNGWRVVLWIKRSRLERWPGLCVLPVLARHSAKKKKKKTPSQCLTLTVQPTNRLTDRGLSLLTQRLPSLQTASLHGQGSTKETSAEKRGSGKCYTEEWPASVERKRELGGKGVVREGINPLQEMIIIPILLKKIHESDRQQIALSYLY